MESENSCNLKTELSRESAINLYQNQQFQQQKPNSIYCMAVNKSLVEWESISIKLIQTGGHKVRFELFKIERTQSLKPIIFFTLQDFDGFFSEFEKLTTPNVFGCRVNIKKLHVEVSYGLELHGEINKDFSIDSPLINSIDGYPYDGIMNNCLIMGKDGIKKIPFDALFSQMKHLLLPTDLSAFTALPKDILWLIAFDLFNLKTA